MAEARRHSLTFSVLHVPHQALGGVAEKQGVSQKGPLPIAAMALIPLRAHILGKACWVIPTSRSG